MAAGFVVLQRIGDDRWRLLGEAARQPGLTARAARERAIQTITKGKAKQGETYAAVLRSEWKIAQEW